MHPLEQNEAFTLSRAVLGVLEGHEKESLLGDGECAQIADRRVAAAVVQAPRAAAVVRLWATSSRQPNESVRWRSLPMSGVWGTHEGP